MTKNRRGELTVYLTVWLAAILFLVACCLPTVDRCTSSYLYDPDLHYPKYQDRGLDSLALGWVGPVAFVTGAVKGKLTWDSYYAAYLAWLANPFGFAAILFLAARRTVTAIVVAAVAAGFAWWFVLAPPPVDPFGAYNRPLYGAHVWAASFQVLIVGSVCAWGSGWKRSACQTGRTADVVSGAAGGGTSGPAGSAANRVS